MAYLTENERKQKISHMASWFTFESVADLSGGVNIYNPFSKEDSVKDSWNELLAKDTAIFIMWWARTFYGNLNGFPGFGAIEWKIIHPAVVQ